MPSTFILQFVKNANDAGKSFIMVEIYKQAAAIPFRKKNAKIEILLITSRTRGKWIIPKGLIDPGDSAPFTALKETIEEAGVQGEVFPEVIGTYEYPKWSGLCHVSVFAMQVNKVLDVWEEMDFRKRHWFDINIALKKVKPARVRQIIHSFAKPKNVEKYEN